MPTAFRLGLDPVYGNLENLLTVGTFFRWHAVREESYRMRLIFGTDTTGTEVQTDLFYPTGLQQNFQCPARFGTDGTLRIAVYEIDSNIRDKWKFLTDNSGQIQSGDTLGLEWIDPTDHGAASVTVCFPTISQATTILWVDTEGKTYSDSGYTTRVGGTIAYRSFVGTIPFSETHIYNDTLPYGDSLTVSEYLRFNPKRFPIQSFPITDQIGLMSVRIGTITDWQFRPDYRILFDNGAGGYATTNWHVNVQNYTSIHKAVKHWSGDYQVGDWSVDLNDPNGEIWGSLYSGNSEARFKNIMLRAMIQDKPLTYVSQFAGQITKVSVKDRLLTLSAKDKLYGLPDRRFVYDWINLGSTTNTGKVWGRVKKIAGTNVYFDDYGDIEYIERKKPGVTWLQSVLSGAYSAAMGFIAGGPIGAAYGFGAGVTKNLPKNEETTEAYYKYSDYNIIPDDTVKSGAKLKFYQYSVSGIATNSNGNLPYSYDPPIPEKTIEGGRFENGILGTFEFSDTNGIAVNDFVYAKIPMIFSGSPNEIAKAILTGSNIDVKYSSTDFASDWDSELNPLELMQLTRVINIDEDISPFDLLKQMFSEIGITFYINENNKFSCRTLRPRNIISSSSGIATYSEGKNILAGFSFDRDTEEVLAGISILYAYSGQGAGKYNSSYSKKLDYPFRDSIGSAGVWATVESRFIQTEDDAMFVACRTNLDKSSGIDKISLPTTLYGVIQNVGDIINVTHRSGSLTNRLFQIDGYSKKFSNSLVDLECSDTEHAWGYGNCKWDSVTEKTSGTKQSGYATLGTTYNINPNIGTAFAFF